MSNPSNPLNYGPQGNLPLGWQEGDTSPLKYATNPYDLAQAIIQRFYTTDVLKTAFTRIYETQAGDRVTLPYLVFSITSGRSILTTDVHYIFDQRVRVTAYAGTQEEANALREVALKPGFGIGTYEFQTGWSMAFFQIDQSEGKEPGRGPNASYVFKANVEYSARTHRGVGV